MLNTRKSPPGNATELQEVRQLGKNLNGYLGETIDIEQVLNHSVAAAATHEWLVEEIPIRPGLVVPALVRSRLSNADSGHTCAKVYISTGIHGDEPAGPLAVKELLEQNCWPAELDLWICPCMNPTGFATNRRENIDGFDLNRQYLKPSASETLAHIAWLERQPAFDLALCVHEDWEAKGFYVYELNPDKRPSLARTIVEKVSEVCPIDRSELIEGRPARDGVIRPNLDPRTRPDWPEAFYLITHKTRLSYTLEAPSDFPLNVRVAALMKAIQTALELVG